MREALKRTIGLEGISGRVQDGARNDQQVSGVLIQEGVRADVQRVRGDGPHDLMDADDLAGRRPAGTCAAKAYQEHGRAADRADVDRTAEWDRQARENVEAIELVKQVDVLAVGHAHGTVRLRKL